MKRMAAAMLLTGGLLLPVAGFADDGVTPGQFTANNVWMMLAAGLVFIMHLGFATLESGLTRAKNTFIVSMGILTYALCGFNLMYPGEFNGYLGFGGLGIAAPPGGATPGYAGGGYTYWTDFLFQAMFAATAATIVSGAVAERIKLSSFMIFTTFFVALVYTIAGSWKWGGGFLDGMGFHDFAGSTLVHSVGGWGALAGVLLLGPRLGKYVKGKIQPIPGSNMPLAAIGVFLLWLGWFGFNGGSVLSADPGLTSYVLVTTCLAAAAGAMGAVFTSWIATSKPDLSMALNGILAGLVGITAGADTVGVGSAVVIGGSCGRYLGAPELRHLGHPGRRHLLDESGALLLNAAARRDLLRRLRLCLRLRSLRDPQGHDGHPGLRGGGARGSRSCRARHACLRPRPRARLARTASGHRDAARSQAQRDARSQ